MNQHHLKRLRKLGHLSQHAVANRSGIERTKLSLYESGHIVLRPDELEKLRAALKAALEKRSTELANAAGSL